MRPDKRISILEFEAGQGDRLWDIGEGGSFRRNRLLIS